jgi:hypothetical protein
MTSITISIEIDDYADDDIDMGNVREWITGEINELVSTLIMDTGVDVEWDYMEQN